MLVGGKRSREYSLWVQGMFAVATDILPGQALEDVERAAVLGNIVDRVLVLEAAWTHDGVSTNERDVRKRIGEMARQARERGGYEQYVFMARSRESAQVCLEETYDICDRAAIVLYEERATVVILYELIATDIAGIRLTLVYSPPATATEDSYGVHLAVSPDPSGTSGTNIIASRRAIKKRRGATVQRRQGDAPWYATQISQTGGITVTGLKERQELAPADYFGGLTARDKGFSDETPLTPIVPGAPTNLRNIFAGSSGATPFVQGIARPESRIPVAPQVQVSGDMADYIRSKAHPGFILVFVGPGGSGSTFMALNSAARIYAAGFSTVFIDGDFSGRAAQYLTRLGIRDSVFDADAQARVLRPGFDLYGAAQFGSGTWALPPELVSRYDFTVIDLPITYLQASARVLSAASRILVTVEASTWGVGKAALALFGVPVDLERVFRERGRLIYNRSDKLAAGIFGAQARDDESIKRKAEELLGARCGLFTALPPAFVVGSYSTADGYWFSDRLFSDSVEGSALFDGVLRGVLA
jgi:hypothetical protein